MSDNWSVEDFRRYRQEKAKQEKSPNKYKNKKVVVDGKNFDSIKESAYYGQCKIEVLTGQIVRFEMQKRYYFVHNGVKLGYYKADFVKHLRGGGIQVVDVKSDFTRTLPRYRKQIRMMLAFYGIKIIEA